MLARSTMNARQRPHVQVQPARRHHGLRTPCSRTSIIRRDGSGVSGPTATQQQQQLCDAQLAHVMPELVVGCATAAPAPLVVFAPASEHLASIDPDAANPRYNMPGLNGLSVGATFGLETGCFTVTSQLPLQYRIQEVHGLLDVHNKALLRGVAPGSFPCALGPEPDVTAGLRRFVVVDENVERLYGDRLRQYFAHHGVEACLLVLPTCEENKELRLVTAIADGVEAFRINRRQEPIIAIGGGVCLDVAGLAANLYRRGTCIIKVPTTLMAVVDASVGIKTAVNFHEKKNNLGTYCPPLGVLYDTAFLTSLDARHISNGSAEVLKMACIKDAALFELLEAHGADVIASNYQGPVASAIIRRSIQGMLEELEYNLWESVLVRLVDHGHTISPELEMAALRGPNMLLHGEAVSIDMALSTELAFGRGLLTSEQRLRVLRLMRGLRLPLWHEACTLDVLMKGLDDMTRARDGMQRVPLMHGIGAAQFVYDITRGEMGAAAARLLEYAAAHGDAAAAQAMQQQQQQQPVVVVGGDAPDGDARAACAAGGAANNVVPFAPSAVLPSAEAGVLAGAGDDADAAPA